MRKPEDLCMLCMDNLATKTNSHIIPSFIAKSLFKGDRHHRGYYVSSDKTHLETTFVQDSDKENYILCPDCEAFFSVLETYWATRIHNRIRNINYADQFTEITEGEITYKICKALNPYIFRLFIYSIIWRCSISNSNTFYRFGLQKEDENTIWTCLKQCIRTKQSLLLEDIDSLQNVIPILPFAMFTSETFIDRTGNLIFCEPGKINPYVFTLNEYMLIISFNSNDMQDSFGPINNINKEYIKLGYFPLEFWQNIMNDFVKRFSKQAFENLNEIDEMPYFMKLKSKTNI